MKTITFEIEQQENLLVYEVSYDEDKINEFCERLKKEASHTVHYDYRGLHGPYDRKIPLNVFDNNRDLFSMYSISNYKKTPVTKEQDPKLLALTYRYEYDVCYYPCLLPLVGKMISGDKKAFLEIMNPSYKNEYVPIRAEIAGKERQYSDLIEKNEGNMIERKLQVLEELKELLLKVKKEDYEIPVRKYYEELQNMLVINKRIINKEDSSIKLYKK